MMYVRFRHTGRRSDHLFAVAARHGVSLMSGRTTGKKIYQMRVDGKFTNLEQFRGEVECLDYVTEVCHDPVD
jgi:hypothetical protein